MNEKRRRPALEIHVDRDPITGVVVDVLFVRDSGKRSNTGEKLMDVETRGVRFLEIPGGTPESLEVEIAQLSAAIAEARRQRRRAVARGDDAAVKRLDRQIVSGDWGRANLRKTLYYMLRLGERLRVLPTLFAKSTSRWSHFRPVGTKAPALPRPLKPVPRPTVCTVCGQSFVATRRDARYCSDRCRQRAHRVPPVTDKRASERPVVK